MHDIRDTHGALDAAAAASLQTQNFHAEVRDRFGVLPNFFCSAESAPGLMQNLWGFAKSGYLDNPLPSLFKERLFVHLSRFCETRYCIVRHVGFLIGEGRPAGDAFAQTNSVEQVLRLLKRPVPDQQILEHSLSQLEGQDGPADIPEQETPLEIDLFNALTLVFIAPLRAERAREAITFAVGETNFEILTAFLAFVRTAHYWTETHSALAFESDMVAVMIRHPDLERLLVDKSDAEWAHSGETLRRALTDLRISAGSLRTTKDRFRALVTATSDAVFRLSPDWSRMWQAEGNGQSADHGKPERDWLTEYINPEDRPQVAALIAEAVKAKCLLEIEHRVKRVDGVSGWSLFRVVPLLNEHGEIIEWFGAARDVTARRNVEEALRESDRRKSEFLSVLSHELRNSLAPLRNGLHIARKNDKPGSPTHRTFEIMDRQLNHMVHLVDDLMDVGRISAGKIELRRERVSLGEVLSASVDACRVALEKKRHTFVMKLGDEQVHVQGDFARLTQVFVNLLSNAAKYTESGGRIELRMTRDEQAASIIVADTGIGIPARDLLHIFELFSQVSEHRGHAEGGLGIGLSLVRRLVELHQGSVSAISPGAGRGSSFIVRLPLEQPERMAADRDESSLPPRASSDTGLLPPQSTQRPSQ